MSRSRGSWWVGIGWSSTFWRIRVSQNSKSLHFFCLEPSNSHLYLWFCDWVVVFWRIQTDWKNAVYHTCPQNSRCFVVYCIACWDRSISQFPKKTCFLQIDWLTNLLQGSLGVPKISTFLDLKVSNIARKSSFKENSSSKSVTEWWTWKYLGIQLSFCSPKTLGSGNINFITFKGNNFIG